MGLKTQVSIFFYYCLMQTNKNGLKILRIQELGLQIPVSGADASTRSARGKLAKEQEKKKVITNKKSKK